MFPGICQRFNFVLPAMPQNKNFGKFCILSLVPRGIRCYGWENAEAFCHSVCLVFFTRNMCVANVRYSIFRSQLLRYLFVTVNVHCSMT